MKVLEFNKEDLKERLTHQGSRVIAYHRTKEENIEPIIENGFKPGWGEMYGKGWYFTYDLASQTRTEMTHYGNALLKCQINPKNLLILDYNIANDVFGEKYTLIDQLVEHYKIYRDIIQMPKALYDMSKDLEKTFDDPTYSAHLAVQIFVDKFVKGGRPKIKGVYGIVFTGNHDGNVLVSYTYDTAIPFEFALTDPDTGQLITNWNPLKNYEVAAGRANMAEIALEKFHGKAKRINVQKYNLDNIEKDFPWLFEADFQDAIFTITDRGEFIWNSGVWKRGVWEGHIWEDGVFKKGKWKQGEFLKGDWEYGNFLGGVFDAGFWHDGLWTEGRWTGRGTWKTGEIKTGSRFVISKEPPANFNENTIDNIVDSLLSLEILREDILQESFKFRDLTPGEVDQIYDEFKKSYEKATGASWDKGRFLSRAEGWTFFGIPEGGVAVREQRSGLVKLVASYGSPKKVMNGVKEMLSEIGNKPIWGVMTLRLAQALEKFTSKEFRIAPKMFVKTVVPHIKHIFGDVILDVKKDGAIVVESPAGPMEKYFIYNRAYAKQMLDQVQNNPDSLPVPNAVIKILLPIVRRML
jgi:hypothetical protein